MSELCGQVERIRKTRTTTSGDQGGESIATQAVLEAVLRSDQIKGLALSSWPPQHGQSTPP